MRNIYLSVFALAVATTAFAQGPSLVDGTLAKSLERTLSATRHMAPKSQMRVTAPLGTPSVRKTSADDIITEAPEGTVYKNMYHAGDGFIAPYGEVYELSTDGLADDVVFADDGTVYLRNPLTTFYTNTYVRGTLNGDTVSVALPQHIQHLDADPDSGEEEADVYLYKCSYKQVDDEGGSFFPTDDQTMKFVWTGDSLIMVNSTETSYLLGACTADGGWYGFGDYVNSYAVFKGETVRPGDGATVQQCAFKSYCDGVESGSVVKMAVDGNDIYLSGVNPNQPDAWIKGTIQGNKATFAGAQYLGVDQVTESHTFFEPVGYEEVYVEEWDDYDWEYYFNPSLEMDYDADAQRLTCDTLFSINQGYRLVNQMYTYEDFSFEPWNERPATPANPELEGYEDYFSDYGYGMFAFYLERSDATGYLLLDDQLYYNIYIDDEVLTFSPDEYVMIDEELTNVPFDYTDRYDLTNYTGRYSVAIYRSGFDKIGVQLTYTGGGETHKSDIVYYVLATGETEVVSAIATPAIAQQPVGVVYHDLSGRSIQKPHSGICIKTFRYADGTEKSVKITVK